MYRRSDAVLFALLRQQCLNIAFQGSQISVADIFAKDTALFVDHESGRNVLDASIGLCDFRVTDDRRISHFHLPAERDDSLRTILIQGDADDADEENHRLIRSFQCVA